MSAIYHFTMFAIMIVSALGAVRGIDGAENSIQQMATVAVRLFGLVTPYVILRVGEIANRARDEY